MDKSFFPPECFRREPDGYLFFLATLAYPDLGATQKRCKLVHDMRLYITKSMVAAGVWRKEDCHRKYFRSPRRRETDLTRIRASIAHMFNFQIQDRFDAASLVLGREEELFGSVRQTIPQTRRFGWGGAEDPEHRLVNQWNAVFAKSKPVLHMALALKSLLYNEIVDESLGDLDSPTRGLIIQTQQLGRDLGLSDPNDLLFTDKWLPGTLLIAWGWQQVLSRWFPKDAPKFIPVI